MFMVRTANELSHLYTHWFITFIAVAQLIPVLYWIVDGIRSFQNKAKARSKNM
ncbi:hypothetical protein P4H66_08820 [Paenibacillus dokdonensis]|uniref:Uncharacterized protein n=1 Tax=Paenibacillus dokdonensis TaxID=2567944 RepID=A0ABU6GP77_9BACL|nr:hypothetical protein [Paenibacillus dokdonensis]MEC0239947.1 hypothetical protein [Paenibacillus dokdonensis]